MSCADGCAARPRFGVFVELAPGVEALCHRSEIPLAPGRRPEDPFLPIGEEYDFKVVKMNEAEKKIGLSLRAVSDDEERQRLEDYKRQAAAATAAWKASFTPAKEKIAEHGVRIRPRRVD